MRSGILRLALALGGFACAAAAVLNRPAGLEGTKNLLVFPPLGVFAGGMLAWLRFRPAKERSIAGITLAVFMLYALFELAFTLFVLGAQPGADPLRQLFPLVPWTQGMLVFAFVLLDPRPALWAGVAFTTGSLAVIAAYAGSHWADTDAARLNALGQALVLAPVFTVAMLRSVVVVSEALSAMRVETRMYASLALTDELTGLPNRRAALRALDQALAQQHRGSLAASVAMVDLDHFKDVNDRYGHDVGDDALRHAARLLLSLTRSTDTFTRWGGEEFLLVCSSKPPTDLAAVCERFRVALETSPVPGHGFRLTASLGGAHAKVDESAEDLLRRADAALYQAKHLGRNRAVLADGEPGST